MAEHTQSNELHQPLPIVHREAIAAILNDAVPRHMGEVITWGFSGEKRIDALIKCVAMIAGLRLEDGVWVLN